MRKKCHNNRNKKTFLKFLAIQCILFLLFFTIMYMSQPADMGRVQKSIIVVDDTQYTRVVREYRFSVFSDGVQYIFHNSRSSGLSNTELFNTVQVGDVISIQYIEEWSLFGKRNNVVDAQTDVEKLRSIEKYNEDKKTTSVVVIVFFVFFELLFLASIFIYVKFIRKLYI